MPIRLSLIFTVALFIWAVSGLASAQTNNYTTNGTEYAIVGSLPGDQVFPDAALAANGGFMVWQDNATDGSGEGISATHLNPALSADLTWSHQRVNVQGTNDQENARVALLKNGGAVFVWQGGAQGFQHIYARFLSPTYTWLTTTDVVVSAPANYYQIRPAVSVLNNSNVVVVWSSFNQAGSNSMQDVYGQMLSPTGQPLGTNFLINQFTAYNQRNPAVAALQNGGFVVAWVSELQQTNFSLAGVDNVNGTPSSQIGLPRVDVYARLYGGNGVAASGEFIVNTDANPVAAPAVAAGADGGFMLAWCARDLTNPTNGWDIYERLFTGTSPVAGGTVTRVNAFLYGDQYAPRVSAIGTDYMLVWTSLAQDGSREGVFGRILSGNGASVGNEFRVNTTTVSQQMQPTVASDGTGQFLALWTGFTGFPFTFDLFAQRYINSILSSNLPPLDAPFVWAPFTIVSNKYQPQLQVSWATLPGLAVSGFQVYVDGVTNAPMATVTSNQWTMTAANGLTTTSTHSFQVAYTIAGGRQSPLSASASGTTWSGLNYYGIPFEWMEQYYGLNFADWPANVNAPLAAGGPTLLQVFLTGGDPGNSATWLKQVLTPTAQGLFLSWSTQPGHTYQVQVKSSFTAAWSNLGPPRFAAGYTDSIDVGGDAAGFYRIQLLQ